MPIKRTQGALRHRKTEMFLDGLGLTRDVDAGDVPTAVDVTWAGVGLEKATRLQEDFLLAAGGTLPPPWGKQDTSAAGAPTHDYVVDLAGGVYRMKFAADDEVETLTLYLADQLVVDLAKQPIFRARVKITADTAFSADDRLVIGLASARDATLDDIVKNVWFRVEGVGNNILVESDDGTTDTNDQDTGVDWVDAAWTVYEIDCSDLSSIKFYVDGVLAATTSAPLLSGVAQPYIEIQKDAGTVVHQVDVDFIEVASMR